MSASNANLFRRLRDNVLTAVIALPAAAGTVVSPSIDFQTTVLGVAGDDLEYELNIPAAPSLADAATLICTLQDSADNVTFAAISGVGTQTMTGAGGVGAPAKLFRGRLPGATRRYFRASIIESAAGGDNSAVSATLAILAAPAE